MRGTFILASALMLATLPALADQTGTDNDADADCSPRCKLGFDCVNGACVPMKCEPACRGGFTCVEGECKSECDPECRSGFVCIHGECKSPCNPPCASNERCTEAHECVRLHQSPPPDDVDSDDAQQAPAAHATASDDARPEAPNPSAQKYTPSVTRIYVGPSMFSASFNGGPLLTDPGGTIAFDFHVDAARVFFLGFRLSGWGDSSGAAITLDLDLGVRPRLWTGNDAAVALAIGGGLGFVDFTAGSVFGFHMPLRIGPVFDFGAFTFEVVGGPALYAQKNAIGAFEGIAEFGARFGE